jgi:allophycocyanin beta subunit
MQDAITAVIHASDERGQYLDSASLDQLHQYFASAEGRLQAATAISTHAAAIVQQAVSTAMPPSETPQGGSTGTRRYAACIRDLDYFLRYATYAMVAGHDSILEERVLEGLKDTYMALGVQIEASIKAIQAMKTVTYELLGEEVGAHMSPYFDYICNGLR